MIRTVERTMSLAAGAMRTRTPKIAAETPIRVGVDLGTAFSVFFVTDEKGEPLAGVHRFADVVRDGIVWDFAGAVEIVTDLRETMEARTGRQLRSGAVTIPPDVTSSDHRAHTYVLESAGIDCTAVVDEPTAANAVLGIRNGAVVDIGGGTTGIAIVQDGEILTTMDEPSGGTHLSLVVAGALKISFEEAEQLKRDPANHQRLFPIVAPVLEKMSSIVKRAIDPYDIPTVHLVGGTSSFSGIDTVMAQVTGKPCQIAPEPMFVTPLGVASFASTITDRKGG